MNTISKDYLEIMRSKSWHNDPNYKPILKPNDWEPETTFTDSNHRRVGHPRCLAWSKRFGRQCGMSPLKGKLKCKAHKGNSAKGIAHGMYKHGRYTESVAGNPSMAEAYQIALRQKGLLNLSPNIAIADARLSLLYQDDIYFSDEIVELASKMHSAWQDLKGLISSSNPSLIEKKAMFNANFEILFKAMLDKKAFEKREDTLTERRRKLTETESKRQKDMAEVILKAEAIGIFAQMGTNFRDLILETIEDKQQQTKVIKGFSEIIDTNIVNFFSTNEDKEEKDEKF